MLQHNFYNVRAESKPQKRLPPFLLDTNTAFCLLASVYSCGVKYHPTAVFVTFPVLNQINSSFSNECTSSFVGQMWESWNPKKSHSNLTISKRNFWDHSQLSITPRSDVRFKIQCIFDKMQTHNRGAPAATPKLDPLDSIFLWGVFVRSRITLCSYQTRLAPPCLLGSSWKREGYLVAIIQ